jgi:peptidyl-prolyl cis-trans isomerase D
MLNYIRKYTGNWGLKVLYFIIALTFLGGFGGIFGIMKSCGTGLSEGTVAVVNRDAISVDDFSRAYRNTVNAYSREFKGEMTQEMLSKLNIPDRVINDLISNEVATQQAHSIGFIVTKQELMDQISHTPSFLNKDHQFDPRIYYAVLRENNITPDNFQNDVKNDILMLKLKKLFYDNVFLSDGEIKILNAINNAKQPENNPQADVQLKYSIAQSAYSSWIKGIESTMNIQTNKAVLARFTQTTD